MKYCYSWQNMATLQNQMNDLFEDTARRYPKREEAEASDWYPAADIYETAAEFIIVLDAPGLARDKFDISLDENRLTVSGTRAPEGEKHRRQERPHGHFVRRFRIHARVDAERIAATYQDGVLRVRLPKQAPKETRRVTINVA